MEISKNHKELLKDLEEVRKEMDVILEDETVLSLPKEFQRLKDKFDHVLQCIEDGEYEEDAEATKEET